MSRQIQSNGTRPISCPQCNEKMSSLDIKKHIKQCKQYVTTYVNNVDRFIQDMTPSYLEFLAAEMDIIKQKIMQHLQVQRKQKTMSIQKRDQKSSQKSKNKLIENSKQKSLKQNRSQIKQQQKVHIKQKEVKIQSNKPQLQKISKSGTLILEDSLDNYYNQIFIEKKQKQFIQCVYTKCQNPVKINQVQNFVYLDQCLHTICQFCFKDYIRNNYVSQKGKVRCPQKDCTCFIPSIQIKQIIDRHVLGKLEKLAQKQRQDVQINFDLLDIVKCMKCHQSYQFQNGKASDAPKKTQQGKNMTVLMAKHYAQNRFQCPKCKSQQCKKCKANPYHLGFDCKQFEEHKLKKKCRYCHNILPKGYMSQTGIKAFDDICQSEDCRMQTKQACSKILKCGHSCYGYIRQKNCIPCLNQKCAKSNTEQLHGQDQGSYCSLCYVQTLGQSPCVKSKCGHIFHFKCLKKRLELKWDTARITFKFCQCPLCSKWLIVPQESPLSKILLQYDKFYQKIKEKALKRLSYQKQDNNEQLKDAKSIYYKNPQKLSLTIFAYFQCYQCHEPYFGGRKSCAQAMNDARQNEKFNPKELICPSCCPATLINDCKTHGKEFISYKCRFCCEIAQWFCWGNTHFCDKCHKKQLNGEYVSRIPKDKLPKCQGKQKCQVGGNHGPNGEQYCLGCALCRQQKVNIKDF